MKLTIYQKPTCTTCRNLMMIIKEKGISFDAIDYFIDPLSEQELRALLKKMKVRPRDVLRTKEEISKTLHLEKRNMSDDELIAIIVKYPELLQRPIVVNGAKAILARPAEKVLEIL